LSGAIHFAPLYPFLLRKPDATEIFFIDERSTMTGIVTITLV
jgi:hypothetical protein